MRKQDKYQGFENRLTAEAHVTLIRSLNHTPKNYTRTSLIISFLVDFIRVFLLSPGDCAINIIIVFQLGKN